MNVVEHLGANEPNVSLRNWKPKQGFDSGDSIKEPENDFTFNMMLPRSRWLCRLLFCCVHGLFVLLKPYSGMKGLSLIRCSFGELVTGHT